MEKYQVIKFHLLAIAKQSQPDHTELMEQLFARVKDNFKGGVQWYGETVKLDLEARGIIERIPGKPEKYKLSKTNGIEN